MLEYQENFWHHCNDWNALEFKRLQIFGGPIIQPGWRVTEILDFCVLTDVAVFLEGNDDVWPDMDLARGPAREPD